ncbi:MAG: hypothetical protein ACD_19C00355G0016 [uncultured bacterium]|nr:MAG: hypothetical protein ACD_19C00355G0016 [uncultured bacterium]
MGYGQIIKYKCTLMEMSLFENYPIYEDYVSAHPPQSHASLESNTIFRKRMAEAIEKEKERNKKEPYNHENSETVFTTNIHLHLT